MLTTEHLERYMELKKKKIMGPVWMDDTHDGCFYATPEAPALTARRHAVYLTKAEFAKIVDAHWALRQPQLPL